MPSADEDPVNWSKVQGQQGDVSVCYRFGRKSMLLVALISSTMLGVSSAFSTSYVMFAISRALCGVALSGLSIIGVVLGKNSKTPKTFNPT